MAKDNTIAADAAGLGSIAFWYEQDEQMAKTQTQVQPLIPGKIGVLCLTEFFVVRIAASRNRLAEVWQLACQKLSWRT